MEIDPTTTGLGAVLGAALIAVLRYAVGRLELVILAAVERGRIRDRRRAQGDTIPPPIAQAPRDEWPEDETTDIKALITRERARRRTERHRVRPPLRSPGERAPRPGTHHD